MEEKKKRNLKKYLLLGGFSIVFAAVIFFLVVGQESLLILKNIGPQSNSDLSSPVHSEGEGDSGIYQSPQQQNPQQNPQQNLPQNQQTVVSASLSSEDLNKVKESILSSPFISDLPKKGIVGLHFFTYQDGQRIELNTILIGKDKILTSGNPDLVIILHAKYISEITPNNLCEVIPRANENGDLGVETSIGETSLLIKYAGILKHRSCFGI